MSSRRAYWPVCGTCGKDLPRRWVWRKQQRIPLQFCSRACIPFQVRSANGKKARQQETVKARLRLFHRELKRLQGLERITGEELVASFALVGQQFYDWGYSTAESKWRRRLTSAQKGAAA